MAEKTLSENFSDLNEVVKNYINARLNFARISLLEKLTRIGTYFFSAIAIIIAIAFVLLFLTFAFAFWYNNSHGSIIDGFLISAAFYFAVGLLLFIFRRHIFTGNIIKSLANIIIHEDEEKQQQTK